MPTLTLTPITRCQYLIVGTIIALTFGLVMGLGVIVPFGDIWPPFLFCGALALGGLLTSAIFAFLPAQGSCIYFHQTTPGYYTDVLGELYRLRRGVLFVSWRDAQGIVTFPSFHTIWAVLLIAAFRGRKLFWPIL